MLQKLRSGSIHVLGSSLVLVTTLLLALASQTAYAKQTDISSFTGKIPVHLGRHSTRGPVGLSPSIIKSIYNLNNTGNGSGTIAIIDAYDSPRILSDLNTFSNQFGLPQCTTALNSCFEKHMMASRISANSSWELESSLDVEWAHAIAPGAKILLVEARSASGNDLLNAISYARTRSDVVAVSMSWGGSEFSTETAYDGYFTAANGAPFFAAAGDNGTGVEWPAVSPNVIGVGGTTLHLSSTDIFQSETAWSGSGGGVSALETEPNYQTAYGVTIGGGMRTVPDVSYDADPSSGVAVYDSYGYYGWYQVGGTSEGAPQWAAIQALGKSVSSIQLYTDAKSSSASSFLRDIQTGTNGTCGLVCNAITGYDTVTGLGSPLSAKF
jgi:subtilase family serine protease